MTNSEDEFNDEINKLFTDLYKTTCKYFTKSIKEKKIENIGRRRFLC